MDKTTKLLVLGGTGYVGSQILKKALKFPKIGVVSLQRKLPTQNVEFYQVKYLTGSALEPESFKDEIAESDVIIHSLGVLLDSTVIGGRQRGADGSYEQVNFETARRVGDVANAFSDKKRKFIYISANSGVPFSPRYLDTKLQAENYLSALANIDFHAFRPGLVVDNERAVSVPLGFAANLAHQIQNSQICRQIDQQISQIKYLGDLTKNFKVGGPTQREDLAKAIVACALSDEMGHLRVFENEAILRASRLYDLL